MKICLVDDEKECRQVLSDILEQYRTNRGLDMEIDEFEDGEGFKAAYKRGVYDIIFLDIYIGETTGMELAGFIREQTDHDMIIFCTTSLEDMPQAFRFHAFEYIIKPAVYERVSKVLDDAIAVLPNLERYIELNINRETVRVSVSDITSITSRGHYLDVTHGKETVSVRMTLGEILALIGDERRFLSINKGIVVNMDHIRKIEDKDCYLDNGDNFPVKVRDSAKIKQEWQDYCFEQIRSNQGGRL